MECVICGYGSTNIGKTTVTLKRDSIVVAQEVVADICDHCGEIYVSQKVTAQLLKQAEACWSVP